MPPRITQQIAKPSQAGNRAPKLGIMDRVAPIGFDESHGIKINLYGKPGTGKTTLWSTFPKPILAVVCSGGAQPGELRSIDTPENRQTIRQVTLEASSELRELGRHPSVHQYRTVVLDHASGLQDLVLKEILGLEEVPVQLTWGLASQQQYGQLGIQMKELLRCLLDLPMNVVIVAQEREFNTEGQSDVIRPFVAAGLTPTICGWLNTAVDYICQTYIRQKEIITSTTQMVGGKPRTVQTKTKGKGVEYCLRVAPDPTYITKFRMPRGKDMPDAIVDPDYDKIMELIRGGNFGS